PRGVAADAEVACRGQRQAAADGPAVDDGDGRYGNALDRIDDALDEGFVAQALLAVGEVLEIRDVRARDEGLAAGAAKDDAADAVVLRALVDERKQFFIHRQRHGVMTLGPVNDDFRDPGGMRDQSDRLVHDVISLARSSASI